MTKTKTKTKTLLILAQCLLIAIVLLGVTYALDGAPSSTPANGEIQRQVRVSDFDLPIGNWQEDDVHAAEVFVKNLTPSQAQTSDPNADSGAVCVRVSLKEFMQVMATEGDVIKDENGDPILFATIATGVRAGEYLTVKDALSFGLTDYGSFTAGNVEYATTNTIELRQGIYGKPMNAPGDVTKLWGKVSQADDRNGAQGHTDECNYEPYRWDDKGITLTEPTSDASDYIRQYIALGGTEEVKLLSEWDGELGDFWLVDDTTADGWVYWGTRLPPQKSTSDLISSLKLKKNPIPAGESGVFRYSMHLDMQATDYTENEVVGIFGDVDGVDTLEALEERKNLGEINPKKFDLIEKLIK